jgi:heme A synthase
MELSLTIYIICLIVFALNVSSPKNSNNLGILVVALITITVVIALGWLIYLTIVDIKNKGCCPKAKE